MTNERSTILLVDDRAENLIALEALLAAADRRLVKATSGKEALKFLLDTDVVLVLLDVQMPDMDGFETADLIRARPRSRHTPIIFITAETPGEVESAGGYERGAVDFIYKPIVAEILQAKVSAIIELEQRVRERTAELLAANQALAESEEKYRRLTEAEPDAIMCFDIETLRFTEVNDAALRLYGYTRAEFLQLTKSDISSGTEPAGALIARLEAAGALRGVLWQHRKKDGTRFPVEASMALVQLRHGRVALCAVRDISERQQAEEERLQLEAQLQQARKVESLSILAGGIAHDFNNLLMAILGNAEMARKRVPEAAPEGQNISQIEKAALRAAELTKQMLAYSGKGHFLVAPVDLSQLVQEMVHRLRATVPRHIQISYKLARDLPAVIADAGQIWQAVHSVVVNAAEAIGDGDGRIDISTGEVDADPEYLGQGHLQERPAPGRYLYVEVADTGGGIPPGVVENVFDPFFSTKFTGRGLGLAATLGIVRGHKGAIRLETALGEGTILRLLFPAAHRSASSLPVPLEPARAAAARTEAATVLVVDDEPSVLSVARMMLEELGYRVLTAPDGRAGVEAFERHGEIAVVLLDMTMPVMNGEEAFRAIRQLRQDARVILSSGYTEDEVTGRFAGEVLDGFLQKPYQLATLQEKLDEVLGRRP